MSLLIEEKETQTKLPRHAIMLLRIKVMERMLICIVTDKIYPFVKDFPVIKAKKGAVATENSICSQVGVDIMRIGGSSVDSIIAASLCIGVVNPQSSGIGG
jgi:gamma-glutamyltranspeptidase